MTAVSERTKLWSGARLSPGLSLCDPRVQVPVVVDVVDVVEVVDVEVDVVVVVDVVEVDVVDVVVVVVTGGPWQM